MADFEKIAEPNELADGARKSVLVEDVPSLLVRCGDDHFVVEDVCTHDGQPLTDGPINGCEITCPRHAARFDLKTGAALCMPATEPLPTFEVETRADGVYARARD